MSENVNNQYDFFKLVNLDADGNLGVIVSGGTGGATKLNDLTDVTTALPGTPTEADDGKILFYDHDINQWTTDDAVTHGTVVINGKKSTAGTIAKGTPVYLVGFDSDLHTVESANASAASTMPVIGLAAENLDNTNSKHITTFGKLTGVDTTSTVSTLNPNGETWAVNDALYMSTTTGGLTKIRPTGAGSLIQRIAKILKVDATGGQIFVFNTARTAGLPNLGTDKLWIGDANGIPQEVDKSTLVDTVTLNKTFTLQEPTASDDITVFRTDVAITIQEVIAVSVGTTPSTTYSLKYSTDRSAAGTTLVASTTTTSTTTGDVATITNTIIPANSFIWIETSAASGTGVYLSIDIRYTEN
jgi:hypothetical protein